jgi:DNA-binding MarR family transcriptional regulator
MWQKSCMSKDLQVGNPEAFRAAQSGPAATVSPGSEAVLDAAPTESLPPFVSSELDALERRAWRAFLSRHARVAQRLEADLMAHSDMPLAEFDVLFQLALTDGHRLRMNELANRVLLSRAGITRLVDRLVADGLVVRAKCASDARGSFAVLTDRGRQRLEVASPGHLAAVKHFFLESFSRPELETLADLMERSAPTE